jgi:hypothetical protein
VIVNSQAASPCGHWPMVQRLGHYGQQTRLTVRRKCI